MRWASVTSACSRRRSQPSTSTPKETRWCTFFATIRLRTYCSAASVPRDGR
jgi:hypothetical protein